MRMRKALLFDFDFEKIRGFLPRLVQPEQKIRYLKYVISKQSTVPSQQSAVSSLQSTINSIRQLLHIELNFWKDVRRIIDAAEKPEYNENEIEEDVLKRRQFADLLVKSSVFRFDFRERELFGFDVVFY